MKRQKIKEFFKQDTILLAKKLLGKLILIKKDGKILGGYIVETEAYLGTEDKACHSFDGKRTPKIEALFGIPIRSEILICFGTLLFSKSI